MRVDHHAYQRATRVAGIGFLFQLAIGLILLLFTFFGRDTAIAYGAAYVLIGLLVWLGLIVLFNQHKLERLEALEHDEIVTSRRVESVFDTADDEVRVAARRLRLMYRWFMPILSLLIATTLAGFAWWLLRGLARWKVDDADFHLTDHPGWAVAICLGFSALSFIVSRFVAGMAKQPAWQNLRGGAAFMVGNSLVTLAIAIGTGFRFFKKDQVVETIAYAIPIFMIVVAAEILLNFVLNLYRPRIPGETPRPAFDSKALSLFAAPDNLVRSLNEAVNYQFGFDITSSWGYQLLLRSFAWLLAMGAIVLMVLNMIVLVEPHEQAVVLRRGRIVGDTVHRSGLTWKLPWPFQTAEIFDVTRVRSLHLTGKQVRPADVQLWTDKLGHKFDKELVPFVVRGSQLARGARSVEPAEGAEDRVAGQLSLVDAEVIIHYRIREDGGLRDYLDFASDVYLRRDGLTVREKALRSIALREVSQALSGLSIDQVLGRTRGELPGRLRDRVQRAFTASRTGIEVVAVNLPLVRPAGDATAEGFEELSISREARQQFEAAAEQKVVAGFAQLVGDPKLIPQIVTAIDMHIKLRDNLGADDEKTVAQRIAVEELLARAGGQASQMIAGAERDRWVRLIGERAEASRLRGQINAYRAAPELYRERETMIVLANRLGAVHKYILCVDPSRVTFDMDLTELSTMLNIGDVLEESGGAQ